MLDACHVRARRLALAATVLVAAASGQDSGEAPSRNGPTADVAWFTDTAPESGLDFVHVHGMYGRYHQPEIMGLGLRLVGAGGARDMVGARVAVMRADGTTLWRRALADGSYASASDPRVLVGLGPSAAPQRVRVIWPGGRIEEWSGVPVDRYTTLTEGTGG